MPGPTPTPTPSPDEIKRRQAQAAFDKKMGTTPKKGADAAPKKESGLVHTLKAPLRVAKKVGHLFGLAEGGVVPPDANSSGHLIMRGMQEMHSAEMDKHAKRMMK